MEIIIKLILSLLFFLCLLHLPYGFYEIVRFTALLGFSILAYQASIKENKTEMIIYICLAILFQPLLKISLGRQLWNIVDVIVGIALIASILVKPKEKMGKRKE
ncbi:MAG: hypothetical protein IPP15_16105 [Saprospiraceae bacterium]|uniref:Uncharacterized protein n=1 Tax=Candidatus Opimibacter skivensis TaxID=2982028 RepID=A0A9D7SX62_9BACT|nr:hypothetical protein [Candidatus Opimibacter skivensis]